MTARSWRAVTNFRDFDGVTRRVERFGSTGAKAERRLVEDLTRRTRAGGVGEITGDTRVRDVAPLWLKELERKRRASNTMATYEDTLRIHVIPAVGMLRVREVTVGVVDRFLGKMQDLTGPAAAKHCRTVLSGVMALAARHDAVASNPVRDAATITSTRSAARALTLEEVRWMRSLLWADSRAVERDIPAIADFMLATGLRIGETLAVTWDALDLTTRKVEVRGTVVRKKGVGLVIQPAPKTASGWRTIHLPVWLVEVLRSRESVANDWNVVFPSQQGKLRERSNTNADLREALDPLGLQWVTSHTFRKTAATLLDAGGLTVREIADQLGHKRISVTQDTYFGRRAAPSRAADVLGRIGGSQDTQEEKKGG
ncbi:MAG: Site-specific integrase [Actinomycetota bacterium]|nr:Site-specific integrase [Actinomycetota bacterium]